MKKKWYIKEAETVTHYWEYEVEAETEAEAIQKVRDGSEIPMETYDDYDLGEQPQPEIVESYELKDEDETD